MAVIFDTALLAGKHKRFTKYYVVVIAITFVSQAVWTKCPLTILENMLRRQYDPAIKLEDSYTVFYLDQWFGISVSPMTITMSLVIIAIVIPLAILLVGQTRFFKS